MYQFMVTNDHFIWKGSHKRHGDIIETYNRNLDQIFKNRVQFMKEVLDAHPVQSAVSLITPKPEGKPSSEYGDDVTQLFAELAKNAQVKVFQKNNQFFVLDEDDLVLYNRTKRLRTEEDVVNYLQGLV